MARQDNLRVVINKHGKRIRMNDAALAIAQKHFGVVTHEQIQERAVPVELLRLPKKIEIIKVAPQEGKKPLPKEVNPPEKIEIKTEATDKVTVEVTEAKPKRTRRKKNVAAKK